MIKERWKKASASACLNDCCCATGTSLGATAGVASASDSGIASSISAANTVNAGCQPKLSISATPIGANRNCPNDPAAVPAPTAMPRHSAASNLPNAASTTLNEHPHNPNPTTSPPPTST